MFVSFDINCVIKMQQVFIKQNIKTTKYPGYLGYHFYRRRVYNRNYKVIIKSNLNFLDKKIESHGNMQFGTIFAFLSVLCLFYTLLHSFINF